MKRLIEYLGYGLLNHIEEENLKSEDILNLPSIDGKPAREWITFSHELLTNHFQDISAWEKNDLNLIKELFELSPGHSNYENSSFEMITILFSGMLIDLDKNTEQSREEYKNFTLHYFSKFDSKKFGLNTNRTIKTQTVFIELVRNKIDFLYGEDRQNKEIVWQTFLNQRIDSMSWISSFFESILQDSLNETEQLLHNILPQQICVELQENKKVIPQKIENATVLFTDFVGFTKFTEKLTPSEVVLELDICFSEFDKIVKSFGLEKIKTLGDGYMCAGGVPTDDSLHPYKICLAALQMNDAIKKLSMQRLLPGGNYWDIRIGIHVGPLVAGVIGHHKFSYDIWGDTVNTASRMESSGIPGGVNISSELNAIICEFFETTHRGSIEAKNKGHLDMFHLTKLKDKYSKSSFGIEANEFFFEEIKKIH